MRYVPGGDTELQLQRALVNGLTFPENMDGAILEVITTGSQQTVNHSLGRKPIGFLVLFKDAECDVWGTQVGSWTNESLFLAASVGNVTLRLFVM